MKTRIGDIAGIAGATVIGGIAGATVIGGATGKTGTAAGITGFAGTTCGGIAALRSGSLGRTAAGTEDKAVGTSGSVRRLTFGGLCFA